MGIENDNQIVKKKAMIILIQFTRVIYNPADGAHLHGNNDRGILHFQTLSDHTVGPEKNVYIQN